MSAPTAIVMNLREYEQLVERYVSENFPDDDEQLLERLRLSAFLVWVRNQVSKPEQQSQSQRPRRSERLAMFCAHANENPLYCPCAQDCYCRTRTCRSKR